MTGYNPFIDIFLLMFEPINIYIKQPPLMLGELPKIVRLSDLLLVLSCRCQEQKQKTSQATKASAVDFLTGTSHVKGAR